jgi:hypothetical protein
MGRFASRVTVRDYVLGRGGSLGFGTSGCAFAATARSPTSRPYEEHQHRSDACRRAGVPSAVVMTHGPGGSHARSIPSRVVRLGAAAEAGTWSLSRTHRSPRPRVSRAPKVNGWSAHSTPRSSGPPTSTSPGGRKRSSDARRDLLGEWRLSPWIRLGRPWDGGRRGFPPLSGLGGTGGRRNVVSTATAPGSERVSLASTNPSGAAVP